MALYLLTAPGANMIGLYRLALAAGAAETGLTPEAFSRGVGACIEAGFCEYDADNEVVWVIRMAHYQLGVLRPGDKRITGCERLSYDVDYSPLAHAFYAAYGGFTEQPKFPDAEAP